MDFVVVLVSWASEIPDIVNVSALRTFRVLRPLRTLTAIPSMRALINSLFKSLPNMQYVLLLMLFLPIVFGVIAVQLWGGLLRGRCMYLDTSAVDPLLLANFTGNGSSVLDLPPNVGQEWLEDDFQDGKMCAMEYLPITASKYANKTLENPYYSTGRVCEDRAFGTHTWTVSAGTMACMAAENPNYGQTHFEAIETAMLWVFADITLEGWVDNMYMVNDVFSAGSDLLSLVVNIYFSLMVLLGGFFMLNLALAVVWDNYQKESDAAEKAINDSIKLAKMERDRNILFRWKAKAKVRRKRRETRKSLRGATLQAQRLDAVKAVEGGSSNQQEGDVVVDDTGTKYIRTRGTLRRADSTERIQQIPHASTGFSLNQVAEDGRDGSRSPQQLGDTMFAVIIEQKRKQEEQRRKLWEASCAGRIVARVKPFVEHKYFGMFITFMIIANTVFMGMEYSTEDASYYTPAMYKSTLEQLNTFCSIVFLLEMVLKLVGIGWKAYKRDPFNLFDMLIVCISVLEWIALGVAVMEGSAGESGGGGGFGVLRVFRILRVFKLAKSWKELNNLIRLIGLSIRDVSSATVLLLVIMFIFTMIGMQLFGGQWDAEQVRAVVQPLRVLLVSCKFGLPVLAFLISTPPPTYTWQFYPDDPPRANFDDFFWSFVTVFQVLTGENWNEVLWGSMKASGVTAAIYFLLLNLFGGFIILNLFLAILLARFEGSSDDDDTEKDENQETSMPVSATAVVPKSPAVSGEEKVNAPKPSQRKDSTNILSSEEEQNNTKDSGRPGETTTVGKTKVRPSSDKQLHTASSDDDMSEPDTSDVEDANDEDTTDSPKASRSLVPHSRAKRSLTSRSESAVDEREKELLTPDLPPEQPELDSANDNKLSGDALGGLLDDKHPVRKAVFNFISHPKFDGFILFLIGISSIMLAMDEPWVEVCACFDPNDPTTHHAACDTSIKGNIFNAALGPVPGNTRSYLDFLVYSDLVITIIFVMEMLLKMIGLGMCRSKDAYFRSGWNALDCIIVILSVIGLATGPLAVGICNYDETPSAGGGLLKALRSMRALRALRPLRVVRRYPALRLVVTSIMNAGPAIMNVLIVMALFFSIFAIYGVQRWMGTMAQCNDPATPEFARCNGTFTLTGTMCGMLATPGEQEACVLNGTLGTEFPRRWESVPANFDHVGNGLLTIFELASGEMWPDIMYNTVDAVAVNHTLVENWNRVEGALFHIGVQLVCAFLMVNVFVGVVIEKYNENKEASQGAGMLTNKQKLWLETMKLALTGKAIRKDTPPRQKWRVPFFTLVMKPRFDMVIMACIVGNTLVLMSTRFDQGQEYENVLEEINFVFTIIFTIEFVLKITGMGHQYFFYGWNVFDFSLVLLSWVGRFFSVGGLASLFRVFRVARMIRLVRTQKGLLNLFKTLIFSFPALVNIGCIVFLFMFIFSCIAMNLFANIKLQENLNEDANFQTFFRSFNTLWRVATGESYNAIMHDCQIREPYCDPFKGGAVDPHSGNCGYREVSPIMFCIVLIFINYMLLNLLIAVILDNFTETQSLSDNAITDEHFRSFDQAWNRFDEDGSGVIPAHLIPALLNRVRYPLGLRGVPMASLHGQTIRKHCNKMVKELQVPVIHGMCDFTSLRSALNAVRCILLVISCCCWGGCAFVVR